MKKVITYGTFDLLHLGHIRLLERAKLLGDYLIVAVTADDFDKRRGKINVQQSLMERIEGVKSTGLADEIIIEEYEGQKIDDIIKYGVDIFTVGSDWVGKFDYLKNYCEVIYLDRTQGVSSTEIRSKNLQIRLGIIGNNGLVEKFINECRYVNGVSASAVFSEKQSVIGFAKKYEIEVYSNYNEFLDNVDAIYIASPVREHYEFAKKALTNKKHVLCEAPIAFTKKECLDLCKLAKTKNLVFMEAIKTAYSTAFNRLMLLAKSGTIGKIVSVDCTCTSLKEFSEVSNDEIFSKQSSFYAWGPTALLPVFSLLGTSYTKKHFTSYFLNKDLCFDLFTKLDLNYKNAVATIKVGKGVKSEGELIISGTKGYIYVPAPWWKTDYFEVRYEDPNENKRYFYQLDGEGIRYELATFIKCIKNGTQITNINQQISESISLMMEEFNNKSDLDDIVIE